jgi:hypothetical protein
MAKKKSAAKTSNKGDGRNPPKDTRYRPGQTGNRFGRPKGSKNLRTLIMDAANEPVIVTLNGKKRRISKVHATAMQLANKAVGGNQPAINKFFDLIDDIETGAAAARPAQFPISEPDLEVLRAAYERMKQCEREDQKDQSEFGPKDNPEGSIDLDDLDDDNPGK